MKMMAVKKKALACLFAYKWHVDANYGSMRTVSHLCMPWCSQQTQWDWHTMEIGGHRGGGSKDGKGDHANGKSIDGQWCGLHDGAKERI